MKSLAEVLLEIANRQVGDFYIYILYKPDGTPFYVGKGKGTRLADHVGEAKRNTRNSLKENTIRKILRNNGEILYAIESWHPNGDAACGREIELISEMGRQVTKTGPLTNITGGGGGLHEIPEELAARISETMTQYCLDHPEFIDNLQSKKNEWIEQKPEEYAEAEKKRLAICATDEVRKAVGQTLKEYYKEHPEMTEILSERATRYFEENPEAVENARQSSIANRTSEYVIRWLASVDEETWQAKTKRHSEFMKDWHASEKGRETTKRVAAQRNESFRTEDHRKHMAKKTAEYIKNNPEADKARREKVKQTKQPKIQARQEVLLVLQDRLFAEGKIKKKVEYVSPKHLYVWKKRGWII